MPDERPGYDAVPQLDEQTRRIVAAAARLFLAQWEAGTPLGDRFEESLHRAAGHVAGDRDQVTTEFYRVALRDPELLAALRRSVRAAAYLEQEVPPGSQSPGRDDKELG